jgi:hypothetical protein
MNDRHSSSTLQKIVWWCTTLGSAVYALGLMTFFVVRFLSKEWGPFSVTAELILDSPRLAKGVSP